MADDLSIVIPAYNEARRIMATIAGVRDFCNCGQGLDWDVAEVIIVSDGSRDDTVALVRRYIESFPEMPLQLIELSANYGKGYAIKEGVKAARGRYILFMDADLSTPMSEISKLRRSLELGFDLAIGSRGLPDSQIMKHQAIYRELMGKVFNLMVRVFVIDGIYDTQCGFKLFRAEVAKQVFELLETDRFGFDVEILLIAQELGHRIIEVPISWENSAYSTVSPLRDAWQMFCGLLRMRHRVRENINNWSLKKKP